MDAAECWRDCASRISALQRQQTLKQKRWRRFSEEAGELFVEEGMMQRMGKPPLESNCEQRMAAKRECGRWVCCRSVHSQCAVLNGLMWQSVVG